MFYFSLINFYLLIPFVYRETSIIFWVSLDLIKDHKIMKNCLSTLKKNRHFRKVSTFLNMLSSRYFTYSYICLRS